MKYRASATILILLAVGMTRPSFAQSQDTLGVAGVRNAYEQLDFELTLSRAEFVIRSGERQAAEDLVEVHTIAALVLVARNQTRAARAHFASALSIDPDLTLDPVQASPRAVELFESVRAETRAQTADPPAASIRYLRVYDPRPAAAYRSLVLPGWGQMYKGQRQRGIVMMALWGTAAAGTVTAHIIRHNKHDAYLDETDPSAVQDRFDSFNRWHKVRNSLAMSTVATWVVSYLDALIFESSRSSRSVVHPSMGVTTDATSNRPSLSLRLTLN